MKKIAFALLLLMGCTKITEEQVKSVTEAAALTEVPASLIFLETFEGQSFFPVSQTVKPTINTVHAIENNGLPTALSVVEYGGSKAARFRLSKDEPLYQGDQYRTEVTIVKAEEDSRVTVEGWYAFKVLFPADGGQSDDRKTSIQQFFEDGSDELTLRTQYGRCYMELQNGGNGYRWDLFSTATTLNNTSVATFKTHPFDEWNQFVFHINHKKDSTGFIEVYKNGEKIHEYHGATIHLKVPKWKIGIYSSFTKSTVPYKIVLYDDVKVGNNTATLADMTGDAAPPPPPVPNIPPTANAGSDITITLPTNSVILDGSAQDTDGMITSLAWSKVSGGSYNLVGSTLSNLVEGVYVFRLTATDNDGATATDDITITVKPQPSPITSFVLVDATTEKDILTIVDGQTISLKTLPTTKLNIRANATPEIKSAVLVLSGTQAKTVKDKGVPFTLQGDAGNGSNYNYGNWNPPALGAYTLKVTPYALANAAGTPGIAATINFTFTQ